VAGRDLSIANTPVSIFILHTFSPGKVAPVPVLRVRSRAQRVLQSDWLRADTLVGMLNSFWSLCPILIKSRPPEASCYRASGRPIFIKIGRKLKKLLSLSMSGPQNLVIWTRKDARGVV
jgi:hypothetical protein